MISIVKLIKETVPEVCTAIALFSVAHKQPDLKNQAILDFGNT